MIYSVTSQSFWSEKDTILYDECILSWNGTRPEKPWIFWVHTDRWHKYAEWSCKGQKTFALDVIELSTPTRGFQVRVEGENLSGLDRLLVALDLKKDRPISLPKPLPPIFLKNFPTQSQLVLDHPKANSLCSPTSLSNALSFLSKKHIDPVELAEKVYDEQFHIYGNWTLNIAEGYHRTKIACHVERLAGFEQLHAQLLQQRPVVVSIQGDLPGAPKPYPSGHLICVIGYSEGNVYCIDPAFPENSMTSTTYRIEGFLRAWSARRGAAYVFT